MRIKRSLPIILGVVVIAAVVTLVVQLRKHAPPEPARLLPSADAFVYINLHWVRTVNAVDQLPPVSHDPEYEQFIQETGFQFERDLEEAAFAVHYLVAPSTHEVSPGAQPRFSEVLIGKIHADRITAYLRKLTNSVDIYGTKEIFNIPAEGRTIRVSILGVDKIAISNHDDPAVIRGMIDRSRKLASPFRGPAFLRQYYKYVPIASLAWVIAKVDSTTTIFTPLTTWAMLFPKPATVVVSARYLRALHLKAEAFSQTPEDAQQITEKISTFLNIFHTAETSVGSPGTDADVKSFFESLKVEQQKDRAVLTAIVPPGFIRKALTEAPVGIVPTPPETTETPTPAPPSQPATPRKRRHQTTQQK